MGGWMEWEAACVHLCLTLCDPTDCSPPGFSVHGILQARILEWVAIPFRSFRPRDWTQVSSGGSAGVEYTCNAGDLGSIPGLGRSPGEGKDYPLQYSGLENSMDCIVHGVAKSQTPLSDFHFTSALQAILYHWATREVQEWGRMPLIMWQAYIWKKK